MKNTLFLIAALLLIFLNSCYSIEFIPEPDYANLRRADVSTVELRTTAPTRPVHRLGYLMVRDFSGNVDDPGFQSMLQSEIMNRGAEGGWIAEKNMHSRPTMTTGSRASSQNPNASAQNQVMETGTVSSDIGILKILLFNYKDSERQKRPAPQN